MPDFARRFFAAGLVVMAAMVLSGGPSGAADSPEALAQRCGGLVGAIAAAEIGLPTGGARIVSAATAEIAGTRYCKATGAISPATAGAPDIRFEVDLPLAWNGKAVQFGGGGYNGSIPRTTGPGTGGVRTEPPPLARGWLVFADDSGHQAQDGNDASFALNDEATRNFTYMHIRKARDVGFTLARRFYGREPSRLYFIGGSTGGREALTAATRWPDLYDGVISFYPTANFTGLRLWGAALADVIYSNNSAGWIPPELADKIGKDGLAACDGLDGATDGIVSNMTACRAGAQTRLRPVTCPVGQMRSDCLSPAQLATIDVYYNGFRPAAAVRASTPSFGGYNILEGAEMNLGTEGTPREPIRSGPNAHHADRADQFFKYFVMKNPNHSLRSFDIRAPGPWTQRIAELTKMTNDGPDDLLRYQQAGGKVILVQGQDDVSVSPKENTALYQTVRDRLGARADSFIRYYLVPGQGHGIGAFQMGWNGLELVDRWVEQGVPPPAAAVGYDNNQGAHRSRPVCAYPAWPRFKGSGSVDDAANFECVTGPSTERMAQ